MTTIKRSQISGQDEPVDGLREFVEAWQRIEPAIDTSAKGLVYVVYLLEREFRRQSVRSLRHLKLQHGEYQVLTLLLHNVDSGFMSPGDLVAALELTSGAISQILRKLETAGLVTRVRYPSDGRRVIVKLTAKGERLARKAFTSVTENENRLLAGYDRDHQKTLEALLNGLTRHLGVKISAV